MPTKKKTAFDVQVGGDYYKTLKIQPIEYAYHNNLGPIEAMVLKYITRHRAKNGLQDIEKAIHLLEMLKELEYSK